MIVELVKPRLFLSKVPMVYGTMISNAIVVGAIVVVAPGVVFLCRSGAALSIFKGI
jgi:hypothetical protein